MGKYDKERPTRVIGAIAIGLSAGWVSAVIWAFGMMAIGQQPTFMNLVGAFGFVAIVVIVASVVVSEFVLFR